MNTTTTVETATKAVRAAKERVRRAKSTGKSEGAILLAESAVEAAQLQLAEAKAQAAKADAAIAEFGDRPVRSEFPTPAKSAKAVKDDSPTELAKAFGPGARAVPSDPRVPSKDSILAAATKASAEREAAKPAPKAKRESHPANTIGSPEFKALRESIRALGNTDEASEVVIEAKAAGVTWSVLEMIEREDKVVRGLQGRTWKLYCARRDAAKAAKAS